MGSLRCIAQLQTGHCEQTLATLHPGHVQQQRLCNTQAALMITVSLSVCIDF